MDKVIVALLYVYFFLSCIPSLTALSSEGTVLPFFAMFVVFLWWCYLCVSEKPRFTMMDGYLLLYIVVCTIPLLLYPSSPKEDWLALAATIQLAFMFVVARVMLNSQKRINYALVALLVGLFALSTLTILEQFQVISLGTEVHEAVIGGEKITRYGSLAGGINRSAFYFGVGILLGCGLFIGTKSHLKKILIVGVIFFATLANLFTYSVGGLVSLTAGFLVLFFLRIRKKRFSFKRIAFGAVGLMILLGLLSLNPRVPEKFDQIQNEEFIYWGTYRGGTVVAAVEAIAQYPLFGAGPAQFVHNVYEHFPFISTEHIKGAHNTLLSIAGESGLIGLLFFTLFAFNVIVLSWRHNRRYPSSTYQILFACLGMALVWSLVFDAQRDKLFWIVLALLAATLNVSPQTVQNRKR